MGELDYRGTLDACRHNAPLTHHRHMLILRAFYRSLSHKNTFIVPSRMEVKLTETENSICELLDGCQKFLESEKGVRTSCRVAGGWVRDKVNTSIRSVL